MLSPIRASETPHVQPSLSRRVNANSQLYGYMAIAATKLIKKGEC